MTQTGEEISNLISQALDVRNNAYAPYSDYRVGAALLGGSGKIYTGVNVENAAYPVSICAERTAIFNAVTHGEREIQTIVVATENGGTPCGACRQVLSEFGRKAKVIIVNAQGKITLKTSAMDLLPHAFGFSDLQTGKP